MFNKKKGTKSTADTGTAGAALDAHDLDDGQVEQRLGSSLGGRSGEGHGQEKDGKAHKL